MQRCIARATVEWRERLAIGGKNRFLQLLGLMAWTKPGSIRARRACSGYPGSAGAAAARAGLDLPARRACRAWLAGPGSRAGLAHGGLRALRDRRPAGPQVRRGNGDQPPRVQSLPSLRSANRANRGSRAKCTIVQDEATRSNVWDGSAGHLIKCRRIQGPGKALREQLALRDRLTGGCWRRWPSWRCWPAGHPGRAGSAWQPLQRWSRGTGWLWAQARRWLNCGLDPWWI